MQTETLFIDFLLGYSILSWDQYRENWYGGSESGGDAVFRRIRRLQPTL